MTQTENKQAGERRTPAYKRLTGYNSVSERITALEAERESCRRGLCPGASLFAGRALEYKAQRDELLAFVLKVNTHLSKHSGTVSVQTALQWSDESDGLLAKAEKGAQ